MLLYCVNLCGANHYREYKNDFYNAQCAWNYKYANSSFSLLKLFLSLSLSNLLSSQRR